MLKAEYDGFMDIQVLNENSIKTENLHDPLVQRPKTDLVGTSGKNTLVDRLVRPARKFTESDNKTNSKI